MAVSTINMRHARHFEAPAAGGPRTTTRELHALPDCAERKTHAQRVPRGPRGRLLSPVPWSAVNQPKEKCFPRQAAAIKRLPSNQLLGSPAGPRKAAPQLSCAPKAFSCSATPAGPERDAEQLKGAPGQLKESTRATVAAGELPPPRPLAALGSTSRTPGGVFETLLWV